MRQLELPDQQDTDMWDIWMSIYHLSIVSVADELELFNCIHHEEYSIGKIANKLEIHPRAIQILAEPLVALNFLNKNNQKFSLTHVAKYYLLPDSPFYWGAILLGLRQQNQHQKILNAIKNSSKQLLFNDKNFSDMWKDGSLSSEAANIFTAKMQATSLAPALGAFASETFKNTKHLLDVGAGSGCFSIAFVQKYPHHKATIFELPAVCEIAKTYLNKSKSSNNILIHAGNFFHQEDWPRGHDGVLLSQIMHDWPIDHCKQILTHAYNSLPPGGHIYIHEMLLDTDRISPLTTACFDLLMFINHNAQQFTKNELFLLLIDVGFKNPSMHKTFGYYSVVSAIR